MSEEIMIEVDHVHMRFNLSKEKVDNLKEYFVKLVKRQLLFQEFYALQDVSFAVKKGEVFGLVGFNGAGKSTLLKLIAGVLKPTIGKVRVNGSVAPLIELGAGFDMNMTGRENIFLNGAILGYPREFMNKKFDEILNFSELDNFIDVPLKNYSSGMIARLGFSIATIVDPDILIVDEVLSVGDIKFQQKCHTKIQEMLNNNTTVLFVSHSLGQVQSLCNRVLWLDKGKVKMVGETKQVCGQYINS
jgi:ABC-2 type transport system ATP-binding protein